jgi:predicted RNase H-like HicB family nuclease
MRVYRALLEQDEDGVWIVRIPEVPGCQSDGKTIHEALERLRAALGLFVDDAAEARLEAVMSRARS